MSSGSRGIELNGTPSASSTALMTAGAELRLRSGWALMGRFDGEFADGSDTFTGTARLCYSW